MEEKQEDNVINSALLAMATMMPAAGLTQEEVSTLRSLIKEEELKLGPKTSKGFALTGWGIEKTLVNFRLEQPLVNALDARAKRDEVSRADVVRRALTAYLTPRDIKQVEMFVEG